MHFYDFKRSAVHMENLANINILLVSFDQASHKVSNRTNLLLNIVMLANCQHLTSAVLPYHVCPRLETAK